MSDNNADLEQRLAALEQGNPRHGPARQRRSPILALGVAGLIAAGGTALYVLSQPEEEVALPTATRTNSRPKATDSVRSNHSFRPLPQSPKSFLSSRNRRSPMLSCSLNSQHCRPRSKS